VIRFEGIELVKTFISGKKNNGYKGIDRCEILDINDREVVPNQTSEMKVPKCK
jgi:hypothetical protein